MRTKSSLLSTITKPSVMSQRFVLYLKVREIEEVNKVLNKALDLPKNQLKRWADENGTIIDLVINRFIDETNIILEKISLDDEVLNLSEKLVVGLRSAVQSIDNLLGPQDELES